MSRILLKMSNILQNTIVFTVVLLLRHTFEDKYNLVELLTE